MTIIHIPMETYFLFQRFGSRASNVIIVISRFLSAASSNQFPVLRRLFPKTIERKYSLLPMKHDFVLPPKDEKNFTPIGCYRLLVVCSTDNFLTFLLKQQCFSFFLKSFTRYSVAVCQPFHY